MKKIQPGDPESMSHDIVAQNIEQLRSLCPEAWTEGKLDFDVLKQLLGGEVDDREEKYGLNWYGKRNARRLALTPSRGTLRPCQDESIDWDTTQNLMIEGDNLEVLKLLQKSYAGEVKLIYIDPPYNTGKDFVYPDDYQDNIRNYQMLTGQIDSDGRKVSSNVESNGRFHTDWLNMIYPRLKIARDLLSDEGVIFISIDDNEVENLRRVCDEVFGEENRISINCHKARASVSNDKIISSNHNFILLYAKSYQEIFGKRSAFGLAPELEGFDRKDDRGYFKYAPVDGPGGGAKGNPHYTFLGVTGYWRFSEERMKRMYEEGRIERVGSGLQQKYYLEDAKKSRKTDTTWWDDKLYTSTASSRLKDLMDGEVFDSPKPVELIQRMLELWVRTPNDLVLDFFAGSGTTAHAVWQTSVADGVKRRYLLVQFPEPLDESEASQKLAATYCKKLGKPQNIAELTKERLRRTREKILAGNPSDSVDLGFRVYRLDSSCINEWDPNKSDLDASLLDSVDHVKSDRTEDDVLCELLLKLGLDLCTPIQTKTIAGKAIYSIGAGALIVCLETTIKQVEVEQVALGIVAWHKEQNPSGESSVVFRDSAFADDVTKTNITAILQQHGLENIRSL